MSEEFKSIMESSGMALWSAYCDKKMELEDANDRKMELEDANDRLHLQIFALETALRNLLTLVDKCRMIERGVGGMTIDAQIARSVYLNVPAYPFEEAREVLKRISHE